MTTWESFILKSRFRRRPTFNYHILPSPSLSPFPSITILGNRDANVLATWCENSPPGLILKNLDVCAVVTGGVMGKASTDWLLLVLETISDFSHLLSSSDPLLAGDTDIRPEYILYCGGLSTKKNYLTIDLVQFSVIYSDVFCMTNKKKDVRFIHWMRK